MKLTHFKALTLDCYGTLIDWETGIFNALSPLLSKIRKDWSRDRVLQAFAQHETRQEAETPEMPYRRLLSAVYGRRAQDRGIQGTKSDATLFGASIDDWPAFPDALESLRYLKQYYRLIILSNVDRASFKRNNERLSIVFDAVYTAEDVHSYKPSPRNFIYMLSCGKTEFGLAKSDILHTAQSLSTITCLLSNSDWPRLGLTVGMARMDGAQPCLRQ